MIISCGGHIVRCRPSDYCPVSPLVYWPWQGAGGGSGGGGGGGDDTSVTCLLQQFLRGGGMDGSE